jgi:DNA-binding HxlR family transcriptional regulator
MATKRRYDDACGLAHAGELIGERWALLVVRELILGPKRFTDLRAGIPRVSPNVLGQRLRELEQAGIVQRRTLPPPAGSKVYELTDWGHDLEPVVLALGAWAARSPGFPSESPVGPDSIILAMKALHDPDASQGVEADAVITLDGNTFHVAVSDGEMELSRDPVPDPDVAVESSPDKFGDVMLGALSIEEAIASGDLELQGSRAALEQILGAIPPIETAPPAAAAVA